MTTNAEPIKENTSKGKGKVNLRYLYVGTKYRVCRPDDRNLRLEIRSGENNGEPVWKFRGYYTTLSTVLAKIVNLEAADFGEADDLQNVLDKLRQVETLVTQLAPHVEVAYSTSEAQS